MKTSSQTCAVIKSYSFSLYAYMYYGPTSLIVVSYREAETWKRTTFVAASCIMHFVCMLARITLTTTEEKYCRWLTLLYAKNEPIWQLCYMFAVHNRTNDNVSEKLGQR